MLIFAEVDNDLFGAGVKHVEEVAMSAVQTSSREVIDALQSVQQIPNCV